MAVRSKADETLVIVETLICPLQISHLHQVLQRLNAYGLSLNVRKSVLAVPEIEFLGHKLTKDGIAILSHRIDAISRLPEPETIRGLRQALGLINFQRRFIKNAAKILVPLTKYLQGHVKNNDKIHLDEEAKNAFATIKTALVKAASLAHPRKDSSLRLYTDASTEAIGGMLVQKLPDESEQTLAYFSRALNDSQKRYSVFDLELFAIFAAVKYFEHFLLDQHFIIVTDHLSLVHAFKRPSPSHSPRQSRQLSYLSEFNCDITHIPGSRNGAADCLSRLVVHHIFEQENLDITLQDIANAQKACIAQQPDIFQFPHNSTILLQEIELHTKVGPCKLFVDTSQASYRILIPPQYENAIIDHYHKLNHLGSRASQRFIAARFVFRDMNRKIKDRVKACTACQQSKVYRHVVSPIASAKMPDARFDTIHADLCGPFPECQGFSYLLVCIDRFSRFVTAYPLRNAKSESVVLGINSFVSMFGQMRILRVDNGVQWNSTLFREYVSYLGCDLCISSTRYPESNGLVERAIKNIKVALTAKLDRNHWLFYLGTIVLSLNTMYREELGGSPSDLVFFQALRLPGDFFTTAAPSTSPFSQELITQMKHFVASLKPTPTRVVQSTKVYQPPELKTCTHVFVKVDPIKPNLQPSYKGPHSVISRSDKTFKILNNDKVQQVAINNIKPCFTLLSSPDITTHSPIFALPNTTSDNVHDPTLSPLPNDDDYQTQSASSTETNNNACDPLAHPAPDNTISPLLSASRQSRIRRPPPQLNDFIIYV